MLYVLFLLCSNKFCFRNHIAWEWAEVNGIKKNNALQTLTTQAAIDERHCYSELNFNPIPSLDTEFITLKVTEVWLVFITF